MLVVVAVEELRDDGRGLLQLVGFPHPSKAEVREGLEVEEGRRMRGQQIGHDRRAAFPSRKDQNLQRISSVQWNPSGQISSEIF